MEKDLLPSITSFKQKIDNNYIYINKTDITAKFIKYVEIRCDAASTLIDAKQRIRYALMSHI